MFRFSVVSAAALLVCPRIAASTEVLAVLTAQDEHEVDVHSEFSKWCADAQSTLTDRLETHQERMNEITGALDSYTDNEGRLRNSLTAQHQDDSAGQGNSIRLMQSESQVWRNTQVKQLVEKQIESDSSLLTGIKAALAWEQQASSRHQTARQQLKSEVPKISVVQKEAPPVVAPKAAKPVSSQNAASVQAAPKDSFSIAGTLENELGPFMGISQLPALQLMQASPVQAMLQLKQGDPASHVDQKTVAAPAKATPAKATPAKATPAKATPVKATPAKAAVTKEAVKAPAQPSPVPLLNPADPSSTFSALTELLQPQALPATPALPQLEMPAHPSSKAAPQAVAKPVSTPAAKPVAAAKPVSQPVDVLEDPAKALVGILQGGEDSPAADAKVTTAAPTSAPTAKVAKASVPAASAPSAQPATKVATTTAGAPGSDSDPEDALMDVMMSGDSVNGDSSVAAVADPNAAGSKKDAPPVAASKMPTLDDFMKSKKADKTALVQVADKTAPAPKTAPVAPKTTPVAPKTTPVKPAAVKPAAVKTAAVKPASVKPAAVKPAAVKPAADQAAFVQVARRVREVHEAPQVAAPRAAEAAPQPAPEVLLQTTAEFTNLPQTAVPEPLAALPALPQIDLASVTVGQWKQLQPPADGNAAHSVAFKPMEDADSQVSSLLAEVSKLSGQSLTTAAPITASSKSTSVLASDLSSLMGLTQDGAAPSFLQVARRGGAKKAAGSTQSRTQMAAAALEADLGTAGVAGRLAKQIAEQDQAKSVEMLSALKAQLGKRELSWGCATGPAAAHAHMVLMLADQGVTLLKAERSTVENLRAEQRGYDAETSSMRAEFVGMLEATLDKTYEAAASDLASDDLAPLRAVASSSTTAFQMALLADAKEAKSLGATWVGTGTSYEELSDEFAKEQADKDDELQKAQRVLAAAGAKAANLRHAVAKEKKCAEAANTVSLLAAVQRGLHILQDN